MRLLLRIAPAAMLPVLLAVVPGVIGYDEDLVGDTVEILVLSDPDEVLQNVVPKQITEAETDSTRKVPLEIASPVGLLKSNLPKQNTSLLHVVICVIWERTPVLQSLCHDDWPHTLGEFLKSQAL